MAISYTSNFNGGELSRKLDGRSDLPIYKNGCRSLENFKVLPQGGVERRTGTEFISQTKNNTQVKLLPFEFSSDVSYIMEIGNDSAGTDGYIRIWNSNDLYSSTPTNVTSADGSTIPYLLTELQDIQSVTRYDLIVLTHPNHPPYLIKRTAITPTFTFEKLDFKYPPLLAKNTTVDTLITTRSIFDNTTPSNNNIKIIASRSDFFNANSVDGYIAMDYVRTSEQRVASDTLTVSSTGKELDVSFTTWSITTDGLWNGALIIERSVDGGAFENFLVLADTTGGGASGRQNVAYNSLQKEGRNTKIRVDYTADTSVTNSLETRLSTTANYLNGLVKITAFEDGHVAQGEILSSIGGRQGLNSSVAAYDATVTYQPTNVVRDSSQIWICRATSTGNAPSESTYWTLAGAQTDDTISNATTLNWSEGAFDGTKGFPTTAAFFQNRLWFVGTELEPASLYASTFDDFYNFKLGTISNDAIKREIDTPEKASWLIGKKDLFLGTTGSAVRVTSASSDELISPSNIQTISESVYGTSKIKAVYTNNVIAYVQKNGLSLREMVYSESENSFSGQDLNLLSEDIVNSGVVEVFTQKQPMQLIWCILTNGDIALLTYERSSEVTGWSKIKTDGTFISGTSVASPTEDSVWFCVQRGSNYQLEKIHKKADLDWYLDAARQTELATPSTNITFTWDSSNNYYTTSTSLGTGLDNKNILLTSVVGFSQLQGQILTLQDDTSEYRLRTKDDSAYIIGTENFTCTVTIVENTMNNLAHLSGKKVQVVADDSFAKTLDIPSATSDSDNIDLGLYANKILVGLPFTSTLRPMPIEPQLVGRISQSRVKAMSKVIARFLNTKGAKIGEQGKQPTNFPVAKTTDKAGEPIALTTGEKRFFTSSDWDREKVIEIIQDLPYPMSVLSLAVWLEVEGG
ncbi:MAG: hypothetical protein Tp118DCM00d2C30442581_46 [Prokaryotic dsDNA virus sp.]|nr:MAG: hypothetical protein Tp118DCM00d2C30442581_46 [Prokaryotic dsDNA virus sp.]|tara:strand:- start:2791 stop:5538 length:2748 start_codon:yes stop_codon:yes gene_type:complete